MSKNVGIIGGGIIGLSCAYYLQKSGHHVTIIDQGDLMDGCSMGNAGMVVPSHIIPLASPGMIAKGIGWMFNSTSPFYVKPRLNSDLIKWGFHFYRHSTKANVERAIPALKELSLLSKSLYKELTDQLPFDFQYHERGLLMLYRTAKGEEEEVSTASIANEHGVVAKVLTNEQVQELEPNVRVGVRGGVYYPGDGHLTPQKLTSGLIQYLSQQGVKMQLHQPVIEFIKEEKDIKIIKTQVEEFCFDEVVVAAGSWSGTLCKKLNINLPMQAGKGYSFTLEHVAKNLMIPSILLEDRIAVTPMGNSLRIAGTMEISGPDHSINMNRVRGLVEGMSKYYPEMEIDMPVSDQVWHGLRPCSPDGLPYLGRASRFKNLIIATGHSMMGLSLAPATGMLVSRLVNGEALPSVFKAFDPMRFN